MNRKSSIISWNWAWRVWGSPLSSMYSSISKSPNVGGNIYPRWIRKRQVSRVARGREEVASGLGRWTMRWTMRWNRKGEQRQGSEVIPPPSTHTHLGLCSWGSLHRQGIWGLNFLCLRTGEEPVSIDEGPQEPYH